MVTLRSQNGKIIIKDGKVGTEGECCCCNCNNCSCTFALTFQDINLIPNDNPIGAYEPPESGTSACWTFSAYVGCGKVWVDLIGLGYYLGEARLNDLTDALAGVPDNLYIMYTIAEAGGVVDPPDDNRGSFCGGCGNASKIRIVFYIFDQLSNCCPHNQQPTIFFDSGVFKLFEETIPTTWPSEGIIGGNPTITVNCES